MKTLKSMMTGLVVLIVCGFANAAIKTTHNTLGKDEVITTYLNAVVHGKLSGIDDAIDNAAQFSIVRGDAVNSMDKDGMIAALKANENIEQKCQCTNEAVQDDANNSVRKVTMKYADFTRTDVITSAREGKEGWKIMKVTTSYN